MNCMGYHALFFWERVNRGLSDEMPPRSVICTCTTLARVSHTMNFTMKFRVWLTAQNGHTLNFPWSSLCDHSVCCDTCTPKRRWYPLPKKDAGIPCPHCRWSAHLVWWLRSENLCASSRPKRGRSISVYSVKAWEFHRPTFYRSRSLMPWFFKKVAPPLLRLWAANDAERASVKPACFCSQYLKRCATASLEIAWGNTRFFLASYFTHKGVLEFHPYDLQSSSNFNSQNYTDEIGPRD